MTITKKISEDFAGSGFAELEFRISGFSTSRKPPGAKRSTFVTPAWPNDQPRNLLNV